MRLPGRQRAGHIHGQHAVGGRDRGGEGQEWQAVEGLTAKDFTVTEDGVPQTINFFEYQKLPGRRRQRSPRRPSSRDTSRSTRSLPRRASRPKQPGDIRYKDRRLLALYFDMTAMPPGDQLRALDAAQKFIRTQMTPADLVAIMIFRAARCDVLQDFTDDRDRLLSIIETLIVGEGQGFDETDRRRQRRRHRRGLRPGRQRVQHLQHRPPVGRAADRRENAGPAQREESR